LGWRFTEKRKITFYIVKINDGNNNSTRSKEKIKSHLNSAIKEAIAGFSSVYESEDTCTGDLFRLMKTKKHERL
jgi:hypothetical protein